VDFKKRVLSLLSRTTHLRFFPAFMFEQVGEMDFGEFFFLRFGVEVEQRSLAGNYFLSQLLFGTYWPEHPEGLPAYLTPAGYALAQRNVDKLELVNDSIQRHLEQRQGPPYDAYFLSNVFDWQSSIDRIRTTNALLSPGARASMLNEAALLLWRNMLATPSLPAEFLERFRVDRTLSDELSGKERSLLYRAVTVARLP